MAGLIDEVEQMDDAKIKEFGLKAKEQIKSAYSWSHIADEYEQVFLCDEKE